MNLGIIGTGRIGCAVVKALGTSKITDTTIRLSPRNKKNSMYLANAFSNIYRMENNQQVLDNSEIIFIAVPTRQSKFILNRLKFKETHTVISFVPFLILPELIETVNPAGTVSRAIPLPTVVHHNCPIPVLNSNKTVVKLLRYIGSPLVVENEDQLHALWTLTGFIAPFFDLLEELSSWAKSNSVDEDVANKYIMEMFHSLTCTSKQAHRPDFKALKRQATTPKGLNEQALNYIREQSSHEAYNIAANNLLKRFVNI